MRAKPKSRYSLMLAFAVLPALSSADSPSATGHAPAGVMFDHAHDAGQGMLGLRYVDDAFSGMRRGSSSISDEALAELGYAMRGERMASRMWMLDGMYGISERATLMLMPQYMRMDMDMIALAGDHGESDHHGETGHDASHRHEVSGWGDTRFGTLLQLGRIQDSQWLLALMLSAPTGKTDLKGSDGRFLHYGMQLGSGTWDLTPTLTHTRHREKFSYGFQLGLVRRLEDENSSGYRLGHGWNSSAWAAYSFHTRWSVSLRLAYDSFGKIEGHYNGPHNHHAPEDLQKNYGGKTWQAGLGINAVLGEYLLGAEWVTPIQQNLNGEQMAKRPSLQVALSRGW